MSGFNAVHIHAFIPKQTVTVVLSDAVVGEFLLGVDRVLFRHITDQSLAK
ncbi:Uncharacterised protein [Vibrio cholerae]|uniref:Uncharacterized protein n=1 Tax=Vibrio cholerae TaxID=666 RepID=A0A655RN98_VIBCL|nr:Uncharacterised protein [Vibrio cholerae]CSD57863.1 Uncharacterised protein [Vibrio cholerae]